MYRSARVSPDSAVTAGHSACGVIIIALTRSTSPSTVPPAANVAHPRGPGNALRGHSRIVTAGAPC